MKFRLLVLTLLVTSVAFAQAPSEATTFILVRHAEKETAAADQMMAKDPPLSAAGEARAINLSKLLERQSIQLILSTNYKRTQLTVKPTAEAKGLDVRSYESLKAGDLEKLLAEHKGETILVCGHSNTIPAIANVLLGSNSFSNFDDADYGNILVVTLTTMGKGKLVHLRY